MPRPRAGTSPRRAPFAAPPVINATAQRVGLTPEETKDALSLSVDPASDIIEISARAASPADAVRLADVAAEVFLSVRKAGIEASVVRPQAELRAGEIARLEAGGGRGESDRGAASAAGRPAGSLVGRRGGARVPRAASFPERARDAATGPERLPCVRSRCDRHGVPSDGPRRDAPACGLHPRAGAARRSTRHRPARARRPRRRRRTARGRGVVGRAASWSSPRAASSTPPPSAGCIRGGRPWTPSSTPTFAWPSLHHRFRLPLDKGVGRLLERLAKGQGISPSAVRRASQTVSREAGSGRLAVLTAGEPVADPARCSRSTG